MSLAKDIKPKALELGFDLVGITDASPIDTKQVELLANWLNSGFAGRMDYMHRNFEKRADPSKLLKNAQSVICVGLNYNPPKTQLKPPDATEPAGRVANYAQYEDYHLFIKKQLRKLIDFIASVVGPALKFKICVDSVPLGERALAARAGLGFIGKNHMLINPKLGTQIFLAEIITNLKLQSDEPTSCHSERSEAKSRNLLKKAYPPKVGYHESASADEESIGSTKANCSNCDECISACPTGALRPGGQFDASKCISYLTIEHKDRLPADLAQKIGDRLFGCDECVLACPYQKDAPVCKNKQFKFYSDRDKLSLDKILNLSRESFEAKFFDSVIKRSGPDRLKRNAQICFANITR